MRQDLAALADCLKWAVKLRHLTDQFDDLIAEAKQDAPLYKFAVWTGLRITELLVLEWADVHDGYVIVRRGKGRKQRIVPLLPQALAGTRRCDGFTAASCGRTFRASGSTISVTPSARTLPRPA